MDRKNEEKGKKYQFENIDVIIKELVKKLNQDFIVVLPSYLSIAQRISAYFGSLRIKYLTFNFTLVALFASILALYTSVVFNINISLIWTAIPLMVGSIVYFIIVAIGTRAHTTTGYEQQDLVHYSCLFPNGEYPEVTPDNLEKFIALFEGTKEEMIEKYIKTLIMQYFHQANHDKYGKKLRKYLISGIIILFFVVIITLILLLMGIFVPPTSI